MPRAEVRAFADLMAAFAKVFDFGRVRGGLLPRPEGLRHAPRLGDASARPEGRVALEDLGDTAHAVVGEVVSQRLQERPGGGGVAVNPQVSQRERAD